MKVETVKIKHNDGFAVINKSDYDKNKHDLYKEPKRTIRKKSVDRNAK